MIRFLSAAVLAAALPLAASAQPARRSAPPDVPARVAALAQRVTLTPDQRQRLDAVSARYAGQTDAAALWAVSAEIQALMTAEQTAALLARRGARADRPDGPRPGARRDGARPLNGRGGRRASAEGRAADPARDAARAVREEFRPRMEALRGRLQAGQITAAEFADQSRALRAETETRLDATRTPEQRQRAAAMRTRREAAVQARIRALGLTAGQQDALRALAAETRPEARPVPGAARPDAAGRQRLTAPRRAAHEARRARVEAILTPQQRATMAVHAALAHAGRAAGRRGDGPRGPGRRGR